MSIYRKPRYSIDHEGMQRVSGLGVIDPDTGVRQFWCAESAILFLEELQSQPGFTRERYCNRWESYDNELAIHPWQKSLPRLRRRSIVKVQPVGLPWQPGKPADQVRLHQRHKSRPGHPQRFDACHMCLLSFLDEQQPPDISPEEAETLKAGFRKARDEVARLYRAQANQENSPELAAYIERMLERAKGRLGRISDACKAAGFEPARPRTVRLGDDPPQLRRGMR